GFEDLNALAYFRMGRGAKILSAYATNGEAGESDMAGQYPLQLAATRREEAARALQFLNSEAYFLNLPDVAAALDTAELRERWQSDTVQHRVMSLISQFRPDFIVIPQDPEHPTASLRWKLLLHEVLRAVERLQFPALGKPPREFVPFALWSVSRVLVDDGSAKGLTFPTSQVHPVWKKTYEAIGGEAATKYESLRIQRDLLRRGKRYHYQTAFPKSAKKLRMPDEGLPEAVPAELRSIAQAIERVARAAGQLTERQVSARPATVLKQLADAVDLVDVRLARSFDRPSRERKILLDWKEGLEHLRLSLLGVTVRYSLSESALTDLQLTYLTVDTVTGLSAAGTTEIYFPAVGRGWVLDETLEGRLPLRLHDPYRLILQKATPYDTPHWLNGLERNTLGHPLYVFILHKSSNRAENFIHRTIVPIQYTTRFSAEILTPIVRITPNARLVFRLTNNSRDGVRDVAHANDSAVVSSESPFRLNVKGASHLDTLALTMKPDLPDGSYLFPLKVGVDEVASYVARKFPVHVDSTKRIGVLQGVPSSPAVRAIRQIGLRATVLAELDRLADALATLDVLVVDRRALSFHTLSNNQYNALRTFVQQGGRLVVFAQNPEVWNPQPLLPGLSLKRSFSSSVQSPVVLDSLHALTLQPNNLNDQDWFEWLYRRSYHAISLSPQGLYEVLAKDGKTGNPLIISNKYGKGSMLYIDLDMDHQWLNVHPAALRLLANVLAG
ncbi:MAG TPA: PIG-L family deacetylase, partial [Bacteroidota bacterium]